MYILYIFINTLNVVVKIVEFAKYIVNYVIKFAADFLNVLVDFFSRTFLLLFLDVSSLRVGSERLLNDQWNPSNRGGKGWANDQTYKNIKRGEP